MLKLTPVILALLLFEPIVIDENIYNQLLQGAHQNMRGPESDYLRALLDQLEKRATQQKLQNQVHPFPPTPDIVKKNDDSVDNK